MLRSTLQHEEGDPAGRLESLQRAAVGADHVLDPKRHAEVLSSIFVLQVQLRRMPGGEGGEDGIDRVELRCESQRVVARPEPGRTWRIPAAWGTCSIYVFGRPGTTFRPVEYPASVAAKP